MTIEDRIEEAIENHRQATGEEPIRVVLSPQAHRTFVTESAPRSIKDDVDPGGQELSAFGIPIRLLSDEPGEFVGVVGGSSQG